MSLKGSNFSDSAQDDSTVVGSVHLTWK